MFSTFRCNNPNCFISTDTAEDQFQTFQTCENDCHSPTRLKGKIRALAEVLLKYFIEPEYYYFICVWDCSSRLADDRTQNGVPWILAALMLTLTDSLDFDNKHVGVNSY